MASLTVCVTVCERQARRCSSAFGPFVGASTLVRCAVCCAVLLRVCSPFDRSFTLTTHTVDDQWRCVCGHTKPRLPPRFGFGCAGVVRALVRLPANFSTTTTPHTCFHTDGQRCELVNDLSSVDCCRRAQRSSCLAVLWRALCVCGERGAIVCASCWCSATHVDDVARYVWWRPTPLVLVPKR